MEKGEDKGRKEREKRGGRRESGVYSSIPC